MSHEIYINMAKIQHYTNSGQGGLGNIYHLELNLYYLDVYSDTILPSIHLISYQPRDSP